MNKIIIASIGLLVSLGAYGVITSNSVAAPAESATAFSTIQSEVAAGAQLYDVRTPAEYKAGHFENAINLPLSDIQVGKLASVPKDQTIYVHCQSGNRSAQAVRLLKQAGFTDVVDLGGLQDVQSSGGKLIQ